MTVNFHRVSDKNEYHSKKHCDSAIHGGWRNGWGAHHGFDDARTRSWPFGIEAGPGDWGMHGVRLYPACDAFL
ncbi:hypothetical protein [Acidovorax sp. Root217]|uniref:hypothetical protein n=1 Tax=Acidovorax sp. Root217 TaxID=1736492 RepID=UPI0012FC15BD|nr:hypothetical protein [Acidovorax sp. Root217]